MRIDAHQHFWRYDPAEYDWITGEMAPLRRDCLPDDLLPLLMQAGLEGCVAVQARQSLAETEFLLALADEHSFIRGVVGWVDLRSPQVEQQLARFAAHPKLVGVRHVVQDEPNPRFMLSPDFQRGIAALEPFGLAYDLLLFSPQLPAAIELVARFPRQRFVLNHLAKPRIREGRLEPWSSDLRRLAELPNVWCKLSGMVTEADWRHWTPDHLRPYLDLAWEAFGPQRLLLGSDWPVCTVAGDYGRVIGVVMDYVAQHPAAVQEAILGGNAAAAYRLSEAALR